MEKEEEECGGREERKKHKKSGEGMEGSACVPLGGVIVHLLLLNRENRQFPSRRSTGREKDIDICKNNEQAIPLLFWN